MKLSNGLNTLHLKTVGFGSQGIVYEIDQQRCVKIYKKQKYFHRELKALQKGQNSPFFPELYKWGDDYIIRELIHGITLKKYLERQQITKNITYQIILLIHTLNDLGFKRLDVRLRHLFLTSNEKLKLIDPTNMLNHKRKFPRKMLAGLDQAGEKERFLQFVEILDPKLYRQWKNKL